MREIKFRGKRIDNGQWVCGYIWIIPGINLCYILTGKIDIRDCTIEKYEVDPETVGQFIIHEDEQDIYEGDKVQEWKHGNFIREFIAKDIRTFIREYDKSKHSSVWKVVGTIYDNPEPLEVGEGCK